MDFACVAQEPTVSSGSPLDDKEIVRQAVDIVDLVGSYIQLRRQGRNFVGLCPWHDDSRPSFQVNPERQTFKCWPCDIGGDVFSFIMQIEGVEFREALEMLAERAGVQLTRRRPQTDFSQQGGSQEGGGPEVGSADEKRTLLQAAAWAEEQFHQCLLHDPSAEPARKYLADRGISDESVEQFKIGFSPNENDWMLRKVRGDANRERILETIGVLARSEDGGRQYDRFRGRLLFSIRDAQSRPIAVGGRILPETGATSRAKYLNSPETPLFHKSRELYALDVARRTMHKSKRALVMEGYTDVVMAHQFGFTDAVAVLGVALNEQHIKVLKRHVDRILLVLDGDEAGQKRAGDLLELFVAQQADVQIVILPEGADPCDFLLQHGAEAFERLLSEEAVDALDHAFALKTRGLDMDRDVHGVSRAVEELVSIIAKAPRLNTSTTAEARFRQERIIKRLAHDFRIDESDIRRQLTEVRRQASRRASYAPPAPSRTSQPQPARAADDLPPDGMIESDESMYDDLPAPPERPADPLVREMMELLVGNPHCILAVRDRMDAARIEPTSYRRIYQAILQLADEGAGCDFDRLMLRFDEPAMKSLLVELDESDRAKRDPKKEDATPAEELLERLIQEFEKKEAKRRRPAQLGQLREATTEDERANELLKQIVQQERSRQGISKPTDG